MALKVYYSSIAHSVGSDPSCGGKGAEGIDPDILFGSRHGFGIDLMHQNHVVLAFELQHGEAATRSGGATIGHPSSALAIDSDGKRFAYKTDFSALFGMCLDSPVVGIAAQKYSVSPIGLTSWKRRWNI